MINVSVAIPSYNTSDYIEKAIKPLLEGGSTLPGLNLNKDDGALESTGYVFIGEDPESKEYSN